MTPLHRLRRLALAGVSLLFCTGSARALPISIESVEVSFQSGTEQELWETIDGVDVGRGGWSVAPRVAEPHTVVFRTRSPVEVERCDITLCFLSGRPASYFHEFTLSVTTDPNPRRESTWERLTPMRFSATGPELSLGGDGQLRAAPPDSEFSLTGVASDAVFQIGVRMPPGAITAFRIDVFPRENARATRGASVAPSRAGDFMLTEFRLEAPESRTTNVALGRPVKASHPLWGPFTAGMLTDGLPGTIAHPIQADLAAEFHFEIDLETIRALDHIALRNRGDGSVPERLSRVLLDLYTEPPGTGAAPVWRGRYRADGTHSKPGQVDVVHADAGQGEFRGRFLRISSDSPIAFSPQLAEVEIYESLALQPAAVRLDDRAAAIHTPIEVPAGTRWLEMVLKFPRTDVPEDLPIRWRLRGRHGDWQPVAGLAIGMPCPPPGHYVFEAQVRHTDREWNSSVLALPLRVEAHFWESRAFRVAMIAVAIAGLGAFVRYFTRRRLARRMAVLEAKATLDEERGRIARDMHDEVGARLSQLAILQEIFAREHDLPGEAQAGLLQLADTARQAVSSLDEVVWAVNPRNDTLASLAEYLSQCATSYLGPLDIACRIDAPLDWPPVEIRAQVRHNIVLALKEALQNVAKHSAATEVTLTLRHDPPVFHVRLADNGRGLPDNPAGPGRDGLANMHERLAAIGGNCSVLPRAGGGTEVEMRAPIGSDAAPPGP